MTNPRKTTRNRSIFGQLLSQFSARLAPSQDKGPSMKNIETALLFATRTSLALEGIAKSINHRLAGENIEFVACAAEHPSDIALASPDGKLTIGMRNRALPAESFQGALDSVLSDPYRGVLSDILFRHDRQMVITFAPAGGEGRYLSAAEKLRLMRITHACVALIAELHQPSAIHWRLSNQLLIGQQYLQIARDAEPWALFARAVVQDGDAVLVDRLGGLLDRSVVVRTGVFGIEQGYAAALSFLRDAVRNGKPIASGHAFAMAGNLLANVAHIDATAEAPGGYYLTLTPSEFLPARPARPTKPAGTAGALSALQAALRGRKSEVARSTEGGVTMSLLLLVALPPLGMMVLAGQVLGSTFIRNALITLGSFAAATFLASAFLLEGNPDAQAPEAGIQLSALVSVG